MTIKKALLAFLLWLGILGFSVILISIDSWSNWALLILAGITWAIWLILEFRDHARDIRYPVLRYRPNTEATKPQEIYDQDKDDKE